MPQWPLRRLKSLLSNSVPDKNPTLNPENEEILVVACGALAKEILFLIEVNGFSRFRLHCVPAKFHLYPDKIVAEIDKVVCSQRRDNQPVLIGFADCGTGGQLDEYIAKHQFTRLPGAHCYEFFAGSERFERLQEAEIGTFYLTDFLARHFNNLIFRGFKLDKHPELIPMMFGHYRKMVFLDQTNDPTIEKYAKDAARLMNLNYERIETGFGLLETSLKECHWWPPII